MQRIMTRDRAVSSEVTSYGKAHRRIVPYVQETKERLKREKSKGNSLRKLLQKMEKYERNF